MCEFPYVVFSGPRASPAAAATLDTNLCVVNTVQQRVKWRNKLSLPLSPDKSRLVARTEASICLTHS